MRLRNGGGLEAGDGLEAGAEGDYMRKEHMAGHQESEGREGVEGKACTELGMRLGVGFGEEGKKI